MIKSCLLATIAVISLHAGVPHFHRAHPEYRPDSYTNPYKSNEVEIYPWRGKDSAIIDKNVARLKIPEISRKKFLETDILGTHTYFKRVFKAPRRVVERWVSEKDSNGRETGKYKLEKKEFALFYRGKKIKYLIIIHELVDSAGRPTISKGNKWVCYDAYWLLE